MLIERTKAARLGHHTLEIIRMGGYPAPSGRHVDLSGALAACRERTVEYPPDLRLEVTPAPRHVTRIAVENDTVLAVGRRMAAEGPVAALNFAAGGHPGGGFLTGARAQEESIARSSGLFHCLDGRQMYAFHRQRGDAMYSHWLIYSPDVPVFRTDEGMLLEEPWPLAILTCAAVNRTALSRQAPAREPEIPGVMRERTGRVLAVAVRHDVQRLILGAWGCGAFGLEPSLMAGIFKEMLEGRFRGAFRDVVFAITDWSAEEQFIGPFRHAFGEG